MSKTIINWEPDKDAYTKRGEIDLHNTIHNMKYHNNDFNERLDRIEIVKKGEGVIGREVGGKVLEIGSGNGYCSVFLAKNRDLEEIHSMECDESAVNKLIKTNYERNDIPEDKYEIILGSFNDIKNKEYYDYVVSLGVIHHSGNLIRTMKSIYNSLKPGGVFIAHEPYMKDNTPNSLYIEKEDRFKNVQGLVNIKESERDDHFFRKCEYLTAFYHSGFDVHFEQVGTDDDIFNALIVLTKPKDNPSKIPHAWF